MKCDKCNNTLPEDSEFCQYCGRKNNTEKMEATADVRLAPGISQSVKNFHINKASNTKGKYCKSCGGALNKTKKCTGCGKQYFQLPKRLITFDKKKNYQNTSENNNEPDKNIENKVKRRTRKRHVLKIASVILVPLLISIIIYGGYNDINANKNIDEQKFIAAKRNLDNLFIAEKIMPDKYEYVYAGVLFEEGKYIESLEAFQALSGTPVPVSIIDEIKEKIYTDGQYAYHNDNLADAETNFDAIKSYKNSNDYLTLIYAKRGVSILSYKNELLNLIGFEDAAEVILKYQRTAIDFLRGEWRNDYYYFIINSEDSDSSSYNLPNKHAGGYYGISDGVYSLGETTSNSSKIFKFDIIDSDTISVYCYKDGSTYTLYRQ